MTNVSRIVTKNHSNYLLVFVLIFICSGLVCAQSGIDVYKAPVSYNFSSDDYDGGIQNWQIQQSSDGFIYVANNYGLLEFDGESWNSYQIEDATRSISLYIDPSDRIYIGGQNQMGYFQRNTFGNLYYTSIRDLLPEEERNIDNIWHIIPYNGDILFNNNEFLYRYDGEKIVKYPFPRDAGFMFSAGPHVFFYSPSQGLIEWKNEEFLIVDDSKKILNGSVVDILPYQKDSYLIFQANGRIFKFQDNTLSSWQKEIVSSLKYAQINTARRLNNNQIALGTQNAGIMIMDMKGNLIKQLSKGKGITDNTVYSLFEDDFQNLWVGMNNGISCVELSSPFSMINESVGVPGTGYAAELAGNKLYLGTNNGVFSQDKSPFSLQNDNGSYELVKGTEGQIYHLNNIGNNTIGVASHRGGFFIDKDQVRKVYGITGVWKYTPTPLKHKILAGTYTGFILIDTLTLQSTNVHGFSESSRVFKFKDDSTVWMSHGFKGVYKLTFNHRFDTVKNVEFYGEKDGFPSNILINLFRLGNQNIFAAEYGIYKYYEDFDLFRPHEDLERHFGKYNQISAMNMDSQGNLYYISDGNFGVLKKNRFSTYDNVTTPFRKINKYLSDDLENIHILDYENILIGAKQGFIHYNPSRNIEVEDDFQTYIRSVDITYANDSMVHLGTLKNEADFTLDPEVRSIKFYFSSPYYDGFNDLRYRYKLENFEEDWSEWTSETQKEYTNLSYGTYSFQVKARNIYNVEGQTATFSFTLNPPWYFSNLAYALYVSIIFLLFGFSLYLLDSKHRVDKRKMELNQKREIQRKDVELEEFEKKSEETITKLKNEKLKSEIEHKNRELTSTTMHLLNKNEFMLGVKSKLQTLTRNGSAKNDELKRIIKNIDRNIAEDEGWDHFTKHFDQVHGDFLKKLKNRYPDLTPQETKLSAYLKMNLNTKEIAQLLNISVRGVEVSRYRLRKKLNIDRNTNLTKFMMNL